MSKYLFTLLLLSPTILLAMGDKPDEKKAKVIVESQELCDPQEETEMPRFY